MAGMGGGGNAGTLPSQRELLEKQIWMKLIAPLKINGGQSRESFPFPIGSEKEETFRFSINSRVYICWISSQKARKY